MLAHRKLGGPDLTLRTLALIFKRVSVCATMENEGKKVNSEVSQEAEF